MYLDVLMSEHARRTYWEFTRDGIGFTGMAHDHGVFEF